MSRPSLLFWSQHSLGLGHLVRSLALANALTEHFDVVLLNGGRMPAGLRPPAGVEVVNLPPLGHDDGYELVSRDAELDVETAKRVRVETILTALHARRPAVVLLELYPFGRKKFAFEIEPLLDAIRALGPDRPRVACSIRDILVNQRRDQARHDERAALTVNAHVDTVLVHSDPAFATLDESFRPATPLAVPVHHTGFVTNATMRFAPDTPRLDRMIVSVGGGMVGEPIVRAAVAAHRRVVTTTGLRTLVVAGPFLPEPVWTWLRAEADRSPWLDVERHVDDLAGHIARSRLSVSQCGYNTTMDLLRAGTPAVVVPYADGKEDEQTRRAERLARLGLVTPLAADDLDPDRWVTAVQRTLAAPPSPVRLDLDGAATSARLLAELAARRRGPSEPAHPHHGAPAA